VAWLLPSFVLLSLVSGKQPQYLLPLLPGFVLLAARALTLRPAAPGRSGRLLPAVAMLLIGAASLAARQARLPGLPAWTGEITPWSGPALMIGAALLLAPPPTSSRREVGLLAVGTWVVLLVLHLGVLRPAGPAYDVRGLAERLRAAQEAGRAVAHVGNYEGQYQFVGRLREPLEEIEPSAVGDWARRHADGVLVTYSRKWNPPAAAAREFVQPYRGQSAMICSAEAIRVLEPAPADAPQR
jgi:4-amino-4-deoxy-L-arabinose transferase-like glycosyltransferase